jgi:proteasome lid subunit RPN8/RPN11
MLQVPKAIVDTMLEQASKEAPRECCGLLAGSNGRVVRCYPTTNVDKSNTTFMIDSKELFNIHKDVRREGLEILSVYHSHTVPTSKAYPSATDVNRAFWEGTDLETYPGCVYLIIGLAEGREPVLKGFQIPDRSTIEEVPVAVID